MTSFLNRVFGRNTQAASRSNAQNRTTISSPSTPPLIPLDLPQWMPPDFNRDSIRLLVFLDSDDVGTELVFDSKTLRVVVSVDNENTNNKPLTNAQTRTSLSRVPTVNNPSSKPPMGPNSVNMNGAARARPTATRFTHRGKQYELLKASNDIRAYADYIFGTTPLIFKGTGMKLHTSKSPLQLMLSRIFAIKLAERSDGTANTSTISEPETAPVNVVNAFASLQLSRSLSSSASVISSTISSIDVLGEDLTNQRFGRLYRRWLKCANRTMKQNVRQPGRRHRRCIGIAFIITFPQNDLSKYKHFEEFFCTHAPLIENHFQKIMTAAEMNINERNNIAAALLDKLFTFKDELYTLYTRPRLQFPAWYVLTQDHLAMSKRRALAQQLCSIIDIFTTAKYGDFLNCVLSAVLSYQLSWLSTVSPSLGKTKQQGSFKSRADYSNSLQNFLQYSPLWGQLIDLYSAYGQPPYICRTVLVGSDPALLNRLLYLLSFFIRPSYLTYQIPNTNLSDNTDEQTRTYKTIRLYIDELIANATPIQDIEPYSPVHSVHANESDISVLSDDESIATNHLDYPTESSSTNLTSPQEFYQLTFTPEDGESRSVNEQDISQLLESLVIHIEQRLIQENREKNSSDRRISLSPIKPVVNAIPNKTLMSLSLFEPNHPDSETIPVNNDYHLDLALSLISSVTSSYSSDFILQAIETTNVPEIVHTICAQHVYDVSKNGGLFLSGETIETSITILINLDDTSVNFYSSQHKETPRRQECTTLIQPLIEHAHLAREYLPADFVLLNMEDSLQEIYFQALAILKYMKANNRSIHSQESVSSFGDSASITSLASGDTDGTRSLATNNTVTDLTGHTLMNPTLTMESSYTSAIDPSSELVQNVLRKFQLQKSDYMFLKNLLRVLETEHMQMIH